MNTIFTRFIISALFAFTFIKPISAQHFESTATISGNDIIFAIKPIAGNITCGWSDIEFFLRNSTSSPIPDFAGATITINTTDFPSISIPYNGMNQQGTETGYNNYWFGVSFTSTATRTYNNGQAYTVCTITLASSPSANVLELVHNDGFVPTYLALTDQGGNDRSAPTGNKFYGSGATICSPVNCPASTPGTNHILPLNGALPVELLTFQATRLNNTDAILEWETAVEQNMDRYEIERESEGNWIPVGFEKAKAIEGRGAAYSFVDHNVPGEKVYYRLKLMDKDDNFTHSSIRNVIFDKRTQLALFPNPASSVLQLRFTDDMNEDEVNVQMIDISGRVMLNEHIAAFAAMTYVIDLKSYGLTSGVYLLRAISDNGFSHTETVIVQEAH